MNIVGMLICQDNISEIRRCIESVYPIVSRYYVMDGGSTDGTWELLNKYKDVYNLSLFQHSYDENGAQRNRLLQKIPKDVWVVDIDQDEAINNPMQNGFFDFISRIDPNVYIDSERTLPLTIHVPNLNLVQDIRHFDAENVSFFASKVLYNDRNLHFTRGYHCTVAYGSDDIENVNVLDAPETWAIYHYAYLNPDRFVNLKKDRKSGKRDYRDSEWDLSKKNIQPILDRWL